MYRNEGVCVNGTRTQTQTSSRVSWKRRLYDQGFFLPILRIFFFLVKTKCKLDLHVQATRVDVSKKNNASKELEYAQLRKGFGPTHTSTMSQCSCKSCQKMEIGFYDHKFVAKIM